jgi:hypothetical protein
MIDNLKIVWQKWIDPFGRDSVDNEFEYTDTEPSFLDDIDDEDDGDIKNNKPQGFVKDAIQVMATPMGIIPVNEHTASSKIFNFWVGHTNFDISRKISDIIEQTPGVETLDIFTRYRFRVAIGKVFDDGQVMRNINKNINKYIVDIES